MSKSGKWNTIPIQTYLPNLTLGNTACAIQLLSGWSTQSRSPPRTARGLLAAHRTMGEEIGFPGSNLSVSIEAVHLYRGEVELTIGRIPSATQSPNLDMLKRARFGSTYTRYVKGTLGDARFITDECRFREESPGQGSQPKADPPGAFELTLPGVFSY